MLELGTIIANEETSGTVHYVVTETGRRPRLEKIEDYIIRRYVVQTGDVYRTIGEVIEDEKRYLIRKGEVDVPRY
jgi:hypothetical protein